MGHLAKLVSTAVGGGRPWFYAEQLAALPAPFAVLSGPELRHTTRALGEPLLAAGEAEPPVS